MDWPSGALQHATFDLGEKSNFKVSYAIAETVNISRDIQNEIFRSKAPLLFTLSPLDAQHPFKIEQGFESKADGQGTLEGDLVISGAKLAYSTKEGFDSLTGACSLRTERKKRRVLVVCSKWQARQGEFGSSRGITNFIITEDGLEIIRKEK